MCCYVKQQDCEKVSNAAMNWNNMFIQDPNLIRSNSIAGESKNKVYVEIFRR